MLLERGRHYREAELTLMRRIVTVVTHAARDGKMLCGVSFHIVSPHTPRTQRPLTAMTGLTFLAIRGETHDFGMFGLRPLVGERVVIALMAFAAPIGCLIHRNRDGE
jgi:hypothetical protein